MPGCPSPRFSLDSFHFTLPFQSSLRRGLNTPVSFLCILQQSRSDPVPKYNKTQKENNTNSVRYRGGNATWLSPIRHAKCGTPSGHEPIRAGLSRAFRGAAFFLALRLLFWCLFGLCLDFALLCLTRSPTDRIDSFHHHSIPLPPLFSPSGFLPISSPPFLFSLSSLLLPSFPLLPLPLPSLPSVAFGVQTFHPAGPTPARGACLLWSPDPTTQCPPRRTPYLLWSRTRPSIMRSMKRVTYLPHGLL